MEISGNQALQDTIPLVVIGASAGGLDPLEQFFSAVPEGVGWCFVVTQHLSPDYRSMMDELLARKSRLRIRHIEDGAALAPGTLFLNQPGTLATLVDGRFRTEAYQPGDSLPHLPIDALFRSAAEHPPDATVGVVLSGSGSDGALGVQALHKAGATVLVQAPGEAAFNAMPLAAMRSGSVDRILRAGEMPGVIRQILDGSPSREEGGTGNREGAYAEVIGLLERRFQIDFSAYKEMNVRRRIQRRQDLRGIATIEDYLEILSRDAEALDELYQDLLIGVTEFYRDPEAIAVLRRQILDPMAAPGEDAPLRIWVPACATGEEAYTIAIELSEALSLAGSARRFRIIATDVHRASLERASAGVFSQQAVAGLDPTLRARYFEKRHDSYHVEPTLRQKVIFSSHDILSDPPFMTLDLISCRNLFIYFEEAAQKRVLSMFLFALKPEGALFLGPSESVGRFTEEFEVLDSRWRLFRKSSDSRFLDRAILTETFRTPRPPAPVVREPRARRVDHSVSGQVAEIRNRDTLIRSFDALLKRYAPPSILITSEGLVLSWFGTAGAFVDTMSNLAEWTVEDIVHPDLHFAIKVAMEKLRQGQLESYSRRVAVDLGGGDRRDCAVRIEALDQLSTTRIMLVSITQDRGPEVAAPGDAAGGVGGMSQDDASVLARRVQELERDLRLTEETLQHVTERLEASGEELQASNEELQASNEELQATNEELQSSNEELHAVNEELVSVSAEHERKIELLHDLHDNTEKVLARLGVGVLFVDHDLRIQSFSRVLGGAFQFESHDVGRPLSVVGPRLDGRELAEVVREVIASGMQQELEAQYSGQDVSLLIDPLTGPLTGRDGPAGGGALIIFRAALD